MTRAPLIILQEQEFGLSKWGTCTQLHKSSGLTWVDVSIVVVSSDIFAGVTNSA